MRLAFAFSAFALVVGAPPLAEGATPRVMLQGASLQLIAEEPEIVTPVGIAFDMQGRLLVVESHTHKRPDDYAGPTGDRIRALADSDGDGVLDAWSTFAEGFQQAMNLLVLPTGDVLLVTRRDVQRLSDDDGDGVADRRATIARLETDVEYPHNGLSGIALTPDGQHLLLGLGENFGGLYKLVGSDGSQITDRGGCGAIFQCTVAGEQVARFCEGFWNPFSITVLDDGRVFTVDNDPDSSPPCRLIHAIGAGDYGYRYEFGRAGVHPLQAWDGELPGTLPMVCGTGEAPTAVVAHDGALWVTSWGDYRIERYRLIPHHATVRAEREVVVQGERDFRPTGMAVAADGALYFADWVDRSYPVHGRGRIWRLAIDAAPNQPDNAERSKDAAASRPAPPGDPWGRTARAYRHGPVSQSAWDAATGQARLELLQAMRWRRQTNVQPMLADALVDSNLNVRLYAVRWIAEQRMAALRDQVAALLAGGEMSNDRYYLGVLSALEWLDGDGTPRTTELQDSLLARELDEASRSPEAHATALRLISPNSKAVTLEMLEAFIAGDNAQLRAEAIRTLAFKTDPKRFSLLAATAQQPSISASDRADAVAGLEPEAARFRDLLAQLAENGPPAVRRAASRAQRTTGDRRDEQRKPPLDDLDAWARLLDRGVGDSAAGRRLFLYSKRANCASCHRHHGRGGSLGPDLTNLAGQVGRRQIIASILHPSQEMAPRYQPWRLETDEGSTLVGLRLPQGGDNGEEWYLAPEGQPFMIPSERIVRRSPADKSIMPEGLDRLLSIDELRDLVAFLSTGVTSVSAAGAGDDSLAQLAGVTTEVIGQSHEGRPIHSFRWGEGRDVLMVIATIHGNEAAGTPLVRRFGRWLAEHPDEMGGKTVVIIPVANPDGMAANRRFNFRDVDLNRNFPAGNWEGVAGKPHGTTPLSEPESRALMRAICKYFPRRVVSIHQPLACVDYDGPAEDLATALAAPSQLPVKKLGGQPGSLGSFVGEGLRRPIVTLELPRDAPHDSEKLWKAYGDALVAALRYSQQTPQQ